MEAKEEINAKKETYQSEKALELVASSNELFAAKGKKVVHINLKKEKPTEEELLKLKAQFDTEGIASVLLNTSHAFHSQSMQSAAQAFEEFLQDIEMNPLNGLMASNLTGGLAGSEIATPKYWSRQLSQTVRFADGVKTLSQHFNHQVNFIEVGSDFYSVSDLCEVFADDTV